MFVNAAVNYAGPPKIFSLLVSRISSDDLVFLVRLAWVLWLSFCILEASWRLLESLGGVLEVCWMRLRSILKATACFVGSLGGPGRAGS